MWSFTGSDKQLWKWSESGNQLINVATGKPFVVGGFTEWRVTSKFYPKKIVLVPIKLLNIMEN